jgi:hypothetical protein
MLTPDNNTEIFCITDDFYKEFTKEITKKQFSQSDGKKHHNRSCEMSHSEIMRILLMFHFVTFQKFQTLFPSFHRRSFKKLVP